MAKTSLPNQSFFKRLNISTAISGAIAFSLLPLSASAETRQHGVHEHGHAMMNVAQEGKNVELSFEIPAMDMVGFEHQPSNQEQKNKVQTIFKLLKQAENVVAFNTAASCVLESAKVESALLEKGTKDHQEHDHKGHHDDHDDHAKHEGHGHDEHDKHDHEEHGHDDHDKHEHEEHGHDDHDKHDHGNEETHSEFELTYHFECESPSKLSELNVKLFTLTTTLEEIEANWFGEKAVKTAELSPSSPTLKLN